jgi:hypothetical protein
MKRERKKNKDRRKWETRQLEKSEKNEKEIEKLEVHVE